MNCRCTELESLEGFLATEYAAQHLQQVGADGDKWELYFECPDTRIRWTMRYPESELHGGGPPLLSRIRIQGDES